MQLSGSFSHAGPGLRLMLCSLNGAIPENLDLRLMADRFTSIFPTHLNSPLIGICSDGEIGVDVEKVSAERGLEDLVASHFSTGERMVLDGLEGGDWVDCFYRVWTLKEAYLKAEGVGLIDALAGIEFDLVDPMQAPIVKSPLNGFIPGMWESPLVGCRLRLRRRDGR